MGMRNMVLSLRRPKSSCSRMMMRIVPLKMLRLLVVVSRSFASSDLKRRPQPAVLTRSRSSSLSRLVESALLRVVELVPVLVELSLRLTLNS